jgi:hypothetical protein
MYLTVYSQQTHIYLISIYDGLRLMTFKREMSLSYKTSIIKNVETGAAVSISYRSLSAFR